MRYRNDPYWTIARFDSKCSGCGARIRKGESIFYYPKGKTVLGKLCGCGENASAEFSAACFDEAQYNGQW